ncbi:Nuclear control of ATPase protein 2 [Podochytrium sp. JEL0797]|nr:Nuclear control of ATPase protein 2 [Podochytrium sp. JEL0797]
MEGVRQHVLAAAMDTPSDSVAWTLVRALDVRCDGLSVSQCAALLRSVSAAMASSSDSAAVAAAEEQVLKGVTRRAAVLLQQRVVARAHSLTAALAWNSSTSSHTLPSLLHAARFLFANTLNFKTLANAPLNWARNDLRLRASALSLAKTRHAQAIAVLHTMIHADPSQPIDSLSLLEEIVASLSLLPVDALKAIQLSQANTHHQATRPPQDQPQFTLTATTAFKSASIATPTSRKQSLAPRPGPPSSDMRSRYSRAIHLLDSIDTLSTTLTTLQTTYGTPSLLERYTIPAVLTLTASAVVYRSLSVNAGSLRLLFSNIYETSTALVHDYILSPMHQMYTTVRYKERRLALMGADSLSSDLESLERMVVDFVRDQSGTGLDGEGGVQALREAVQRGDLSVVLKSYEGDLKNPIRNAIGGDLIRTLLIQLQKSKVDLELAMSALDKLLQSNELNFTLLSVIPVLLLSYGAYSQCRQWIRARNGLDREQGYDSIRTCLRDLERLLNRANNTGFVKGSELHELSFTEYGMLLIELDSLRTSVAQVPRKYRDRFVEDVEELMDVQWSVAQRMETVKRMGRWGRVLAELSKEAYQKHFNGLKFFCTLIGDWESMLTLLDNKVEPFCPSMSANTIALFIRFKRWEKGAPLVDFDEDDVLNTDGEPVLCQGGGWNDPKG